MEVGENRIFKRIDAELNTDGRFVLYWMQIHRRLNFNFALQRAVELARSSNRPLLIYEGLRPDYPHSSDRFHGFLMDGMAEHCAAFAQNGGLLGPDLNRESMAKMFPPGLLGASKSAAKANAAFLAADCYYLPFLPRSPQDARGFLVRLCNQAVAVVSDEFPTFIIPGQNQALQNKLTIYFETVDANGIIPLKETKSDPYSAYLFRKILQKRFTSCFKEFPLEFPIGAGMASGGSSCGKAKGSQVVRSAGTSASTASSTSNAANASPDATALRWDDLGMEAFRGEIRQSLELLSDWYQSDSDSKRRKLLEKFPLDHRVELLPMRGHSEAGRSQMIDFIHRMPDYPEKRNDPDAQAASGLSPYLHFGRVSIHEIVRSIFRAYDLGDFPGGMVYNNGSKGFFPGPPEIDAFLDEALTWRETG
ncbi:MAG: hypothetical protein KDK37_06180, partial [Leptospiraceae bacterium]|nr:hypothetical protein [Leptospiraceae bacterium]